MPETTSNYPIIKIKLFRPSVGSDFISPSWLFSKLDPDSKCCLTLILAQAMATQMEWAPLKSIINKGLNIITKEQKARSANKYVSVQVEYEIR